MITDFLGELHESLVVPARRRRRILAEVEDHLLCAAAELHAGGLTAVEAERRAVAAFGDAGELGRELTRDARGHHALRAGRLSLPLACLTAWLGLRGAALSGVEWPVPLAGFVLAQVALTAGGLSVGRAWLVRRGVRRAQTLLLIRRGTEVVLGCAVVVIVAVVNTFSQHAGVPGWAWGALGVLGLGAGLTARELLQSAWGPVGLAADHDLLSELEPVLGSGVVSWLERRVALRRRPWRFGAVAALGAGAALAVGHGLAEGPPGPSHLLGALLAGLIILLIEASAALVGWAVLGGWLGIRPQARGPDDQLHRA